MTDPGHRIPGLSGGPPPQWAAPHRVVPPQPPAGPSRPIREHRLPATILLIVTTLALFAASAVVGRPDDGRSRSPVMAYLPPSGTRVVLQTSDGKAPSCFEIAEEDGLFQPATATIEGSKVRLTSPTLKHPRYVRYAWQPFTRANLVNADHLPASTFRGEARTN